MVAATWRRWTLGALVALVVPLLFPILSGYEAKGAAQETTVADMVIWTFPTGERVGAGSGNCIAIGAGTLNVSLRVVEGNVGPIEFFFYGFEGLDPGSRIETVVSQSESVYSLRLTGGIYCYSIMNRAFVDTNAPVAIVTSLGQGVSVRLTLSP
jgi:hypothetical protein